MRSLSRAARTLAKRALLAAGVEVTRVGRTAAGKATYSGAESVIAAHLHAIGPHERYCVDIAAADGKNQSNTYRLFLDGWEGLAVEADPPMFARLGINYISAPRVQLHRGFVTPDNVAALLAAAGAPERFGFLSLDIDGYDHDVLRAILERYRPALICAEINEKIPPPIKFAVRYSAHFAWDGGPCYGQSICALDDLRAANDYVLLGLEYNNAFLAPSECGLEGVTPAAAYRRGYLDRADRLELMPWNAEFEAVLTLPPQDAAAFVEKRFARYGGLYDLSL